MGAKLDLIALLVLGGGILITGNGLNNAVSNIIVSASRNPRMR
jgi:F0F1-type ATP synthase membrane subunit c/vacuolar-type H+-ATPase subunit K